MSSLPSVFESLEDYESYQVFGPHFQAETLDPASKIFLDVLINGKLVKMKLDTGAQTSQVTNDVKLGIGLSTAGAKIVKNCGVANACVDNFLIPVTMRISNGAPFQTNILVGSNYNLLSWVDVVKRYSMTVSPGGRLQLNPLRKV